LVHKAIKVQLVKMVPQVRLVHKVIKAQLVKMVLPVFPVKMVL
jgi:hypothetical protein